jgi:hypothetical protein
VPMTSPRFTGDRVLDACRENADTISQFRNADGLTVKRVQTALVERLIPVGPQGADGWFGPDTADAVVAYKRRKGLFPDDPVIGPGTSTALDDDFAVTAPGRDDDLGDFTEFCRWRRVEPFAAAELTDMQNAGFLSWQLMLALFALDGLDRHRIVGIAANSRLEDLEWHFLAVAANPQDGEPSWQFFEESVTTVRARNAYGMTVVFDDTDGVAASYLAIQDDVLLGRAASTAPTVAGRVPKHVHEVLAHELTHARNLPQSEVDQLVPDSDANVFTDTAMAAQRSAVVQPNVGRAVRTAEELANFNDEITARHVGWIVEQERAGDPNAPGRLTPGALAAAVDVYVTTFPFIIHRNGYLATIAGRGESEKFAQLALWLAGAAKRSFSDVELENNRTRQLFADAAAFCALRAGDPLPPPLPEPDGLFPLPKDFVA